MKLVVATRNINKLEEIQTILDVTDCEIIALSEIDRSFEIVEDGKTLEENAQKKAVIVMEKFGFITLGEDTGLEVAVLKGQPGIYSARYAGPDATYEQNRVKLLKALKSVPDAKRTARFRCVCVLAFPKIFNRTIEIFEGICEGKITEKPFGTGGFGYDPIFIPRGYNKTFAELSPDEKNKISHRGKVLQKVKVFLKKHNNMPKEGVEPSCPFRGGGF